MTEYHRIDPREMMGGLGSGGNIMSADLLTNAALTSVRGSVELVHAQNREQQRDAFRHTLDHFASPAVDCDFTRDIVEVMIACLEDGDLKMHRWMVSELEKRTWFRDEVAEQIQIFVKTGEDRLCLARLAGQNVQVANRYLLSMLLPIGFNLSDWPESAVALIERLELRPDVEHLFTFPVPKKTPYFTVAEDAHFEVDESLSPQDQARLRFDRGLLSAGIIQDSIYRRYFELGVEAAQAEAVDAVYNAVCQCLTAVPGEFVFVRCFQMGVDAFGGEFDEGVLEKIIHGVSSGRFGINEAANDAVQRGFALL